MSCGLRDEGQSGAREVELDPDEVCRLYLEEGLSLRKIGEHYGLKDGRTSWISRDRD